jgi:predicted patatin/cPLA2 family phospholipase
MEFTKEINMKATQDGKLVNIEKITEEPTVITEKIKEQIYFINQVEQEEESPDDIQEECKEENPDDKQEEGQDDKEVKTYRGPVTPSMKGPLQFEKDNLSPLQSDYDPLVLSGGSTKGIVSLGALQYLYDNFLIQKIETYIGTSSGAMICYLLTIGYTPVEIIVYICTHQLLEKLQHFNIVAMLQGRGASSFSTIQEQLEKMTITKIGFLPTLLDIKTKYGKTLVCVTHNLTEDRTEYLSHETYPHLPCLTAIRMASNLPLIFENYKYGGSFYTDGGISDNFAINIGEKMGKKVLGILLMNEIESFNSGADFDTLEFIYKLMFIPVQQAMEYKIKNASEKCDIFKIRYKKLKFFNFNITSKDKLEMFSSGFNYMREHFK